MATFFGVASFPRTLEVKPWIAVHEFPHRPDRAVEVFRPASDACALADRTKEEGFEVRVLRNGREPGAGDAVREPNGEAPLSLPEVVPSSSSMDIRRRVRGRSVDAVGVELVFEEGDPLVGCMAGPAESVEVELHMTGGCSDLEDAWQESLRHPQ